ncbi:hypothetical protein CERSUDRAFT_114750 [Gelatoporia subvermispora B]|uniref:Uncharacterized protein n=1 Tax=Ceriporiopsis subvermispora (strain B) TaxID=914234 RepID=M2PKL6_CERS8|nr:hypothetical protein CERSUDRAFT_114750 [Gelatoporia subvermispora B]
MFGKLAIALTLCATLVAATTAPFAAFERRDASDQIAIACSSPTAVANQCECPTDNNGDRGVMINFFPGYQCAYPGGACTWDDGDGALQNTQQTNCPESAPCPDSGCVCPIDNNHDTGVLINVFSGYQCAYAGGACTWDFIAGRELGEHPPDQLPDRRQVHQARFQAHALLNPDLRGRSTARMGCHWGQPDGTSLG